MSIDIPPSNDGAYQPPSDDRFLSREACVNIGKQVASMMVGGGHVRVMIESIWMGTLRWARNRITECGDIRNHEIKVSRRMHGEHGDACLTNRVDTAALQAAVRRAERISVFYRQRLDVDEWGTGEYTEQHLNPNIWSDTTYTLDAERRADVMHALVRDVEQAGMLAAGYIQVEAHGRSVMSDRGRALYYPYTEAQYSVTVRDPQGTGSGWAGVSHYDWAKIDAEQITRRALDKCLRSRNPVAIEPGRYTTILEPQAASELCIGLFDNVLDRGDAESTFDNSSDPYWKSSGFSHLGEQIFDARINVAMDPMDPELGHVPFTQKDTSGLPGGLEDELEIYRPVQWLKDGVVTNLSTSRDYNVRYLGKDSSLRTLGAYRMWSSTPAVSMGEMIATTKRGLLVSRFYGRLTRDGLWLIENGKVTKAAKNMRWDDEARFCLQSTRLEQIGAPERVFHPFAPILIPALKIKDFNFVALADAI